MSISGSFKQRQTGAAALFAAIGMIGVLAGAAFAINLAQIHLAKRQLQNMANLSAMDAARAAGGCLAPDRDRQVEANQAVTTRIEALDGDAAWLEGGKVDLGRFVIDSNHVRRFVAASEEQSRAAYAFEVDLQRPFPNLLLPMPGVSTESAVLSAKGVAAMAPVASFSVGSFLLTVGPSDQLLLNEVLTAALGGPVNLSVLSYQGLVDSSVQPDALAEEMGLGSSEELLNDPIGLPGLLAGLANVLFDAGSASASAAVDALAAVAPSEVIILGDVVGSPQETVQGAGQSGINTMELMRALLLDVGSPTFQITPGVNIPGVASAEVSVALGQVAEPQIGPATQDAVSNYMTRARNTQGSLGVVLELLPIQGQVARLNLSLDLADAEAELREIRCASRSRDQHEVDLGVETSISSLSVNNPPANPLVDLGVTQICWVGAVQIADAQTELLDFIGPFGAAYAQDNTQSVGTDIGLLLVAAMNDLVTGSPPYVCGPTGPLIDPVVAPVLTAISAALSSRMADSIDPLLMPLARALGVNFGGADVTVHDVTAQPPTLIHSE